MLLPGVFSACGASKWPLWAHLSSTLYLIQCFRALRRACFRQAQVARAMLSPGALCRAGPLRFHPVPPNAWEFGEGVDSARGVAAIVVCCCNSSCNTSCDAIARNGRRTIAFFLLFRMQYFVCSRLHQGMFQTSGEVKFRFSLVRFCDLAHQNRTIAIASDFRVD